MPQGYDKNAPYDAIIVAGSVSKTLNELESQLVEGGRLSYVLKTDPYAPGQLMRALKYGHTGCEPAMLDNINTPYLPSFEQKEEFTF
jgi:protein-L-isoaspartate(D-aspartate) O-methyltransferase